MPVRARWPGEGVSVALSQGTRCRRTALAPSTERSGRASTGCRPHHEKQCAAWQQVERRETSARGEEEELPSSTRSSTARLCYKATGALQNITTAHGRACARPHGSAVAPHCFISSAKKGRGTPSHDPARRYDGAQRPSKEPRLRCMCASGTDGSTPPTSPRPRARAPLRTPDSAHEPLYVGLSGHTALEARETMSDTS